MLNSFLLAIFIVLIVTVIYEWSTFDDCYKHAHSRYLKSCHAGLIRGIVTGCALGNFGFISAIHQGAVFGIMNPVMLYIGF
jgi:hypothetical protein